MYIIACSYNRNSVFKDTQIFIYFLYNNLIFLLYHISFQMSIHFPKFIHFFYLVTTEKFAKYYMTQKLYFIELHSFLRFFINRKLITKKVGGIFSTFILKVLHKSLYALLFSK